MMIAGYEIFRRAKGIKSAEIFWGCSLFLLLILWVIYFACV